MTDTAQVCGNCQEWRKSTDPHEMGAAWPNIPGACFSPLLSPFQPSDTFSNEGEDCEAWTPK